MKTKQNKTFFFNGNVLLMTINGYGYKSLQHSSLEPKLFYFQHTARALSAWVSTVLNTAKSLLSSSDFLQPSNEHLPHKLTYQLTRRYSKVIPVFFRFPPAKQLTPATRSDIPPDVLLQQSHSCLLQIFSSQATNACHTN